MNTPWTHGSVHDDMTASEQEIVKHFVFDNFLFRCIFRWEEGDAATAAEDAVTY